MEYTEITKQVIDFQKMSFSNWYNAMAMVQDQTTSAMDMVLDQSTWVPEDGRKAAQNWLNVFQEERNRFKVYVDEGFSSMEKYIAKSKKAVPAKAK
jgi:Mg2+/Co2+ transporter CorB